MVKGGRFPCVGGVTLIAGHIQVSVQIVVGFGVATSAVRTNIHFDKCMRKWLAAMTGQLRPDVIAMASDTVLFN